MTITGTSGSYYVDAFESRRSTYIGPLAQAPSGSPSLAMDGQFKTVAYHPPLPTQNNSLSLPDMPAVDPVFSSATFTYDGDGNRVSQTINGVTTYFVGNYYELTGAQVTKYYYAGAQRVAMRKYTIPQPMTVEYFLSDHLGSTSITTDSNGAKVSEMRYTAWGEVRYSWKSSQSTTPAYSLPDYTYTGQYSDSYINLLWYGSRHYDPELGRFIQPDSIVPTSVQGVQAYDRYAYVSNNPVRYTDPTGHMMTEGCGDEGKSHCHASDLEIAINAQKLAKLQQGVYDRKCAAGNSAYCSGWSNSSPRLIIGFHAGAGVTMDLGYGGYTYDQTDLVFDFKSGTFYVMKTTGEGTYVGVPNGAALEGYVGTTNVHGIPSSATPDQVADLLAGPNMDIAGDIGLDLLPDVETSVGKGLSVDLDPDTGTPITTTAGPMYTTETKIGAGVSLLPLPIDFGGQGGHSETVVPVFYQLPFWPFR
jgi:RHS repeat-associated protein